jgi:hypothetical protein
MDWERIKPVCVSVEFQNLVSVRLGYTFDDLCGFMEDLGYGILISEWYSFGDDDLKVPTWRRFSRYPRALEDQWAWGNIICVRREEEFERLFFVAQMAENSSPAWNTPTSNPSCPNSPWPGETSPFRNRPR